MAAVRRMRLALPVIVAALVLLAVLGEARPLGGAGPSVVWGVGTKGRATWVRWTGLTGSG